jgi:hypothetical protein
MPLAKVTIYLPDQLEDAVRAHDIGMSVVCQKALEHEVRDVELRQQAADDLQKVVERLRGTQQQQQERERASGFDLGVRWARQWATLEELQALAVLNGQNWTAWIIDENHSLYYSIVNERLDGKTPWTIRLGPGEPFVDGLIAGALEVYEAVADQLSK